MHVVVVVGFAPTGKGEAIETTLAALQVVPEPFRSFANTLVDICAYAGQYFDLFYSFNDSIQNERILEDATLLSLCLF